MNATEALDKMVEGHSIIWAGGTLWASLGVSGCIYTGCFIEGCEACDGAETITEWLSREGSDFEKEN